ALANRAVGNMMMLCTVLVSVASFAATAVPQGKNPARSRGSDPDSGLQLYKRYCALFATKMISRATARSRLNSEDLRLETARRQFELTSATLEEVAS
ncbi:MAG: hypothetical protein WA735_17110, partial [Candidatus Acidiferrales bacterium]